MRLLVSAIPYDAGKSGISTYVREVVKALHAEGHALTLLVEPDGIAEAELSKYGRTVRAPKWTRPAPLSMLWHLFILPFWIRRHRGEFDAMAICAANRRVCAWYPLATAATVHDLANFHVKGKYSRSRMFYLAKILPHYAMKAQRLVAVSAATKADMVKYWGAGEDEVTVLYNGLPALPPPSETGGKNLLYISRIEHPGKNHVRLIEAYGKLPKELASAHPLVLAGADWKDAEAVHDAAKASPHADLIRFTGFVPGNGMERLWAEAGYYVFPSLFEGFGLTLAEAMARGIPSASSNNGSLGEIAADAAITFDPRSADDIAKALEKLLSLSAEEKGDLIAKGRERAKAFSWLDHARGLERILSKSEVFGVRIDCESNDAAVEAVRSGGEKAFAFVNAHCLNLAWSDREYRAILMRRFEKVWPDGVGVRMAGRKLGFAVPENVNGTDLFPMIAKRGGLSFWFLGGREGVADEALRRCAEAFPESKFLGATSGYHKDWTEQLKEISAARPDVLLVAMGVPMQEKWIDAHIGELKGVGSVMAVGGLLDFLSGRIPRAPKFVRRMSLEWIWRLAMEPRRMFKRYVIGNFLFLHRVGLQRKGVRP